MASLSLDLEQLIIESNAITKTISTSKDEVQNILSALERLKLILSVLHTPGLNSDVDSILYDKLGATSSSVVPGNIRYCDFILDPVEEALTIYSSNSAVLYNHGQPCEAWCVSETVTASRSLAIVSVLRSLSLFEGEFDVILLQLRLMQRYVRSDGRCEHRDRFLFVVFG